MAAMPHWPAFGGAATVKYLELSRRGRKAVLGQLGSMPAFLERTFTSLSEAEAVSEGPNQTFSPVEQCWHLADLERDGFARRIRRLLQELEPVLPDFDGGRIAVEREYRKRTLVDGMVAFRKAREDNLAVLGSLERDQWFRTGTQEGVGRVMMCDLPHMMQEHDRAHRDEIHAWLESRRTT